MDAGEAPFAPRTHYKRPMFIVHCADSAARTALLAQSAAQLARAAEGATVRLTCASDDSANADGDGGAADDDGTESALDIAAVQRALHTSWMGRVVVRAAGAVRSTQDVLRGAPFRAPLVAGAVAVARAQTAGRGRGGTSWAAPTGALAFSVEVHARAQHLPFVQYGAALAVVDAARAVGGPRACTMRVKWPNDVVVDGRKVAGVLCEAALRGRAAVVVVGVGVNVANSAPGACVSDVIGTPIAREEFLAAFLDAFERFCDALARDGFAGALEQRYLAAWVHSGQCVALEDEHVSATIIGLAPDGAVRVRRPDGSTRDLPPDVTSLDLGAGVLRAKRPAPRPTFVSPSNAA